MTLDTRNGLLLSNTSLQNSSFPSCFLEVLFPAFPQLLPRILSGLSDWGRWTVCDRPRTSFPEPWSCVVNPILGVLPSDHYSTNNKIVIGYSKEVYTCVFTAEFCLCFPAAHLLKMFHLPVCECKIRVMAAIRESPNVKDQCSLTRVMEMEYIKLCVLPLAILNHPPLYSTSHQDDLPITSITACCSPTFSSRV